MRGLCDQPFEFHPRIVAPLTCVFAAALSLAAPHAQAWVLTMTPGTRTIYLQVGAGTYTGGTYQNGGTPANNATINVVSVSVPAAAVGNGTAQAMTSNSAVGTSFYDGYAVCNPPNQVYVAGWSRPGLASSGSAVLSVTAPTNLTNAGGSTIPFSQISWTSTANGNTNADIAAGTFGGTLTLATIAANTWVEDCLTFSYKNTNIVASGVYTGRATYTLSLP
jgi:hypothetical protein